jgi:hypothetical protein
VPRKGAPVDDVDVHGIRQVGEPQDRIVAPVAAGDPGVVERHLLEQGPADRLDDPGTAPSHAPTVVDTDVD